MIQVKTPDGHTIQFGSVREVKEYMNGHAPSGAKTPRSVKRARYRRKAPTGQVFKNVLEAFAGGQETLSTREVKRLVGTRDGRGLVAGTMTTIKSVLRDVGLSEDSLGYERRSRVGYWTLEQEKAQRALEHVG